MSAERKLVDCDVEEPIDEVAAALAWHYGDAEATIRTLLADCEHLRQQVALARSAISVGFTRGWLPSGERHEE